VKFRAIRKKENMISEEKKIVPILNSANVSTGTDCDSINMENYHKATLIFTFGTVTTDITITPTCGATEGAKTTAVPLLYAKGGAAIGTAVAGSTASCDVLAAWTAHASAASITAASNLMVIVEINAASLTNGQPWLTVTVAAGTSGICHCVAILEPRYSGNRSATALK
jgi:hypothetical protein